MVRARVGGGGDDEDDELSDSTGGSTGSTDVDSTTDTSGGLGGSDGPNDGRGYEAPDFGGGGGSLDGSGTDTDTGTGGGLGGSDGANDGRGHEAPDFGGGGGGGGSDLGGSRRTGGLGGKETIRDQISSRDQLPGGTPTGSGSGTSTGFGNDDFGAGPLGTGGDVLEDNAGGGSTDGRRTGGLGGKETIRDQISSRDQLPGGTPFSETGAGTASGRGGGAPTRDEFGSVSAFVEASAEHQFDSVDEGEIFTVRSSNRVEPVFTERGAEQAFAGLLGSETLPGDVSFAEEAESGLGVTMDEIRAEARELNEDIEQRRDVRQEAFETGQQDAASEAGQEARQEAERRQEQMESDLQRGALGNVQEIRDEAAASNLSDQLGFQVTEEDVTVRETTGGETSVALSEQAKRAAFLSSTAAFLRRDADISQNNQGQFEVDIGDSETANASERALEQRIQTGEAFGGETQISAFGQTLNLDQATEDIAGAVQGGAAAAGDFVDDANLFRPTQGAFVGGDDDQQLTGGPSVSEASEDFMVQAFEGSVNTVGGVPKGLLEAGETAFDPDAYDIAGAALKEGGQTILQNSNQPLWTSEDVQSAAEGTFETGQRLNDVAQANPEAAASVGAGLLGGAVVSAGSVAAAPTVISRLSGPAPRTARALEFGFDPVRSSARAADSVFDSAGSKLADADLSTPDIGPDVSLVKDPDAGLIDVDPIAKEQLTNSLSLSGRTPSVFEGAPDSPTLRFDIGEPDTLPTQTMNGESRSQTPAQVKGEQGASGRASAQVLDDPDSGLFDVNVNTNPTDALRSGVGTGRGYFSERFNAFQQAGLARADRNAAVFGDAASAVRAFPERARSGVPSSPTLRFDIGEPDALPSTPLGGGGRLQTVTEYDGDRGASGAFSAQLFDDPYSGPFDLNVNTRPREAARAFTSVSFDDIRAAGRARADVLRGASRTAASSLWPNTFDSVSSRLSGSGDGLPAEPTFRVDIGEPDATPTQTLDGESVEQTRTEYVGDRRASGPFSVQAIGDADMGLFDLNVNTGPSDAFERAGDAVTGLRDVTLRVDPSRPPRTPMTTTVDAENVDLTADEASVFDTFDDVDGETTGQQVDDVFEGAETGTGGGGGVNTAQTISGGGGQVTRTRVDVSAPDQDAGPNAEFRGVFELGETGGEGLLGGAGTGVAETADSGLTEAAQTPEVTGADEPGVFAEPATVDLGEGFGVGDGFDQGLGIDTGQTYRTEEPTQSVTQKTPFGSRPPRRSGSAFPDFDDEPTPERERRPADYESWYFGTGIPSASELLSGGTGGGESTTGGRGQASEERPFAESDGEDVFGDSNGGVFGDDGEGESGIF